MVSVSRLEVVFSKSNVCFGGVIVALGDGGLVLTDDWRHFPLSGHVFFCRQLHVFCVVCRHVGVSG